MLFVLPHANFDMTRDPDVEYKPLAGHDVNVIGFRHVEMVGHLKAFCLCPTHAVLGFFRDFLCEFPDLKIPYQLIVIPNPYAEGGRERDLTSAWATDGDGQRLTCPMRQVPNTPRGRRCPLNRIVR